MKTTLFALAFASTLLGTTAAFAKDQTAKYTVNEWTCAGCAKKSAKAIKQLDGVKSVDTNVDKKELTVVYDDAKLKEADIAAAVKKLKFNCD